MRFLFGLLLGAALMWLWLNREALGFVVDHRKQIDAATRLQGDLHDLGVPGF
jgi:hypothetical protein